MKKQDYTTLAKILKNARAQAERVRSNADSFHARDMGHARHVLTESLARELSEQLHVDKPEFLKACGIE